MDFRYFWNLAYNFSIVIKLYNLMIIERILVIHKIAQFRLLFSDVESNLSKFLDDNLINENNTGRQNWTVFVLKTGVTLKDFDVLKTNPLSKCFLYVRISRHFNLKLQKWFFSVIFKATNVFSKIHLRHRYFLAYVITNASKMNYSTRLMHFYGHLLSEKN